MYKEIETNTNPLSGLNYSFSKYVEKRKAFDNKHVDGNGLPDYAYKMDYEHRKRIDAIPGLMKFMKRYCATTVPQALQEYNMQGVMVGPDQFPEIYKMTKECAETLGIGIPNVLVVPALGGDDFNACTYAMDDVEPIIIMTGLMIERMSPEELKAIIAHECGHIHNHHSLYGTLVNILTNTGIIGLQLTPGMSELAALLTSGAQYAISMWSRAAEVSADRAALICTGDAKVTEKALSKFMYNGANISRTVESEINIDALYDQLNMTLNNPNRINELLNSHPLVVKRVIAVKDFSECETLYNWRPDLKTPEQTLYSKNEIDEKCKKYIDVLAPKGAKK